MEKDKFHSLPADCLAGAGDSVFFWATRPRFTFRDAVLALNVVSSGWSVTSLVQIDSGTQKGSAHYPERKTPLSATVTLPQDAPDVYYFILDSYGRDDLLKQAYGYDNSCFH